MDTTTIKVAAVDDEVDEEKEMGRLPNHSSQCRTWHATGIHTWRTPAARSHDALQQSQPTAIELNSLVEWMENSLKWSRRGAGEAAISSKTRRSQQRNTYCPLDRLHEGGDVCTPPLRTKKQEGSYSFCELAGEILMSLGCNQSTSVITTTRRRCIPAPFDTYVKPSILNVFETTYQNMESNNNHYYSYCSIPIP